MKSKTLNDRFLDLVSKYAVTVPQQWELTMFAAQNENGISIWGIRDTELNNGVIPLFPWRSERRFVELRRIVETKTLEEVALCRFSHVTDDTAANLNRVLYQEFDLLEWIVGSPIVSVSASTNGSRFSNVLARLENGTIASVEAGTTLPSGTAALDRHELIARRGVASDRVVDTHIPQQSVCLFDQNGVQSWTDTDAELFGLENEQINAVRAAFELARTQELAAMNITQHDHLLELIGRVRA